MSSKDYFNQVASQWDSMRSDFFSETVRESALAVAGVKPGQIAADIGAGTGFISAGLVEKGLAVIAVDQSEKMLAQMRRNFASVDQIEYRVGEAENLPLSDAGVDYAFANMYLHHVEQPPEAIKEMARTLKPGGKLVITDLDEHDFEFLVTEQHDRWMGFKREDVAAWFTAAGLKNVSVNCTGSNCCADSECGSQSANVSVFVAYGEKS
jgi:ubiquinone/menaquinone biosynthesis C-methylase UbiE